MVVLFCRQPTTMSRLLLPIALCLLGLAAASVTNATAQTEQDDAGLERGAREARDTYKGVMSRQRRGKYVCMQCQSSITPHIPQFHYICAFIHSLF